MQTRYKVTEELKNHSEWVLQTKINTLEACNPDYLISGEIKSIIDNTLQQLPNNTKRIFLMSRTEGLSYSVIAKKMNLSQKSIEYHISKALEQFRISLKDFI